MGREVTKIGEVNILEEWKEVKRKMLIETQRQAPLRVKKRS